MRAPRRERDVYFLGAGTSCAYGLPNTAALLGELVDQDPASKTALQESLRLAIKTLYPDGGKKSFLPPTVDFFASLQAFIDIGAPGLPGVKLPDAAELHRNLKLRICRLLVERTRAAETRLRSTKHFLAETIRPGNVVVTTNWDLLVENYAHLNSIPLRRSGEPGNSHVLLLKLHGSVDWCQWRHRKSATANDLADFSVLTEAVRRKPLDGLREEDIVRVRAIEHPGRHWQKISARTVEPYLVTMYRGKGPELSAITDIWHHAYGALSRARRLEIVGYSLPEDDLEIRTLLRAGIQRGNQKIAITVRNPAPDVHARFRHHVDNHVVSDYQPVQT